MADAKTKAKSKKKVATKKAKVEQLHEINKKLFAGIQERAAKEDK